jgi:predicted NUDIX family NTP pyrophosphohydrolase
MAQYSAGILFYRLKAGGLEVLLVHPGGPFWAKKDAGSWSIPKGLIERGEELIAAAMREVEEELGLPVPAGELTPLGEAKQPSGKVVHIWSMEADIDTSKVKSNVVELAWPPKSGKLQQFPEIDKATWFSLARARAKLLKGQVVFLERLAEKLGADAPSDDPTEQASLF